MSMAWGSNIHPVLCSLIGIHQRTPSSRSTTNESRLTLSTHDRHKRVWRCCGERDATITHDRSGVGPGRVRWARLLRAAKIPVSQPTVAWLLWGEILRAAVRLHTGAGNRMWPECVGTPWTLNSPTLSHIMFGAPPTTTTNWSKSGKRCPKWSAA